MADIETERLLLRAVKRADLPQIHLLFKNPAVMRHLEKPLILKQSKLYLERLLAHWEQFRFGWWAVFLKQEERLIGLSGLGMTSEGQRPEVELGYLLAKSYWGRGLATEAAKACLRYGFEALRLERIIAITRFVNIGGRRVAEKAGMKCLGPQRLANRWNLFYQLTKDEFSPDTSFYLVH